MHQIANIYQGRCPLHYNKEAYGYKPSSKLLFGTISNYHNHTLMKVEFVSEQDTQERELILTSMFNCPKCSPCKMTHTVQLLACHIHMGY